MLAVLGVDTGRFTTGIIGLPAAGLGAASRRHAGAATITVMVRIRVENGVVLLPVKVVPGASRTRYLGEWDERAKFAVAAPPEKGKANRALIAFLADLLKVHRRSISVTAGGTSPQKTIRIEGVAADAVRAALLLHRP